MLNHKSNNQKILLQIILIYNNEPMLVMHLILEETPMKEIKFYLFIGIHSVPVGHK